MMFAKFVVAALLLAAPLARAGACSDAADSAIVANATAIDATAETCGFSCVLSGDPSTCIANCMVSKAGLTAPCAKCFGDDGVCTKNNCALQCLSPQSQTCLDCSKKYCLDAFNSCSGMTSISAMSTAQCTADDEAKLTSRAAITADLKACGVQCKADGKCWATCMQGKTGVSSTCSTCFTSFGSCAATNCLIQCIADPSSASCQQCTTQKCEPALDACTGASPSLSVMATAQCTAADEAKLNNKATITAELKACGVQCKADSNCMATCMQGKTGVSSTCSTCFKSFSTCAATNCLFQCIADPSSDSCQQCTTQKCEPALETCTGSSPSLSAMSTAQCTDADDAKLTSRAAITADLKACGVQCRADGKCWATCMQGKTGVSSTCSTCFTSFGSCAATNCLIQCIADPSSASCQQCTTQKCEPALDACTGASPKVIVLL